MKNVALIFGGGTGSRMKSSSIPKQFLIMNGKPIIIHTIEIFENHPEIDEIVVVCLEPWIDHLNQLLTKYNLTKVVAVVPGGDSGQDSIYKGLKAVESLHNNAIVLIHDAVRPNIRSEVITKNIASVKQYNSAITVVSSVETSVVSYDGEFVESVPLRKYDYIGQAPQSFYLEDILKAHEEVRHRGYDGIVDSCTLMKSCGYKLHLIEGNRGNIKITTDEDFYIVRALFQGEENKQFIK